MQLWSYNLFRVFICPLFIQAVILYYALPKSNIFLLNKSLFASKHCMV